MARSQSPIKYDLRGANIKTFAPESQGSTIIGGETVEGNTATGSQIGSPPQLLTREEVLALLSQIKAAIALANLPGEIKAEANATLKVAQKATEPEQPKQEIALANLESMAETLETASKTAEAGQKLWREVSPILVKVAGWLGGVL